MAENEDEEMMLEFEEEENEAESSGKEKVEPLVCPIDFESSVDEANNFKDVCVGWQYISVEGSYWEAGTAGDVDGKGT